MATTYYAFDDSKNDGTKLHGSEWDVLVRIIDAQLQGALALHGSGVAAIPDQSSLLAELDNGGVLLHPGAAVLRDTVRGLTWGRIGQDAHIAASDFPNQDSEQNFIHLAIQVASSSGAPDTRETGTALVGLSSFEHLDGHELLAQITVEGGLVTAVHDRRRFVPGLSSNVLWRLFFGSGRIVGIERTQGQSQKQDGQLTVVLPVGSQWFVDGTFVTLDVAVEIAVPADQAAGVWGRLSLDEAGYPTVRDEDWLDAAPARGAGVLGLVKTDATQVLSVEFTTRDIIQAEPVKQERFESIESTLATLSGNPESGEPATGEVTRTEFNALKTAYETLSAELAALKERFGLPTTGTVSVLDERLARDVGRLEEMQSRDRATDSLLMDASVFTIGVGDGQDLGNGIFARDIHSGNTHVNPTTGEES